VNNKPIIIVAGEPYSIFLEIFFKTKKKFDFKKPIILIASKKLILLQMKKLGFNFELNIINEDTLDFNVLEKKKINLINVNFEFNKAFDKISNKSNSYISKSFKITLKILKKKKCSGLINGPISKENFLQGRFLGITEYLIKKTNTKSNFAMLIYNKKLSVSPITTHLPIKDVNKNITKNKIVNQVKLIKEFYKKQFKRDSKIAITGLNPHCESNFKTSEEKKMIIPSVKHLNKMGYNVSGPFAADTMFMKEQIKKK